MYLNQVNNALEHRITGGSEYCWKCYPNARFLDYSSDYGYASVTYNVESLEIYEATVEMKPAKDKYSNKIISEAGPYRWLNPDFKDAMYAEADTRKVDKDQAWDDIKWIDLEVEEDYLEKATAIFNGEEFDERILLPIDINDELFTQLAKEAHRRDITFNALCMEAISDFIKKVESGEVTRETLGLPIEDKMDVFTVTIEDANDGSGDGVIQLPDQFIKQEDWREGDVLDWEVVGGEAVLRNLTKQEREGHVV